jgi:hypothetical protein
VPPHILAEQLRLPEEPLAFLLNARGEAPPRATVGAAARALLDLPPIPAFTPPSWLAPHQAPAATRLTAIIGRYGGAVLADAVGLGKSYVALAVAMHFEEPFTLVVPAVLVAQWRALCARFSLDAPIVTHESLSTSAVPRPHPVGLVLVDEAHRFRNPDTRRYRALARLALGARVLLVTATPVHNRLSDLLHMLRLFLRDDALAALGLPSLKEAARTGGPVPLDPILARLVVARSRERSRGAYPPGPAGLDFPHRSPGKVIRAGVTAPGGLLPLVREVSRLGAGGMAPLLRLTLLSRLASSLPAFRESVARCEAFCDIAAAAAAAGRALEPRDFQRLFPRDDGPALQLAFLPLLVPAGETPVAPTGAPAFARLRALACSDDDPKARRLDRLLADRTVKTIVFTTARATVRHLLRLLKRRHRAGGVTGRHGLLPDSVVSRDEVLRAFAPRAQGAPPPVAALVVDVLLATDLLSEGLNLQDAERVVHYDLPWTPARLAQRVGRIDRLGSTHDQIETVTFLPPRPLEGALRIEKRLATKAQASRLGGTAELETVRGRVGRASPLDWCDHLQTLAPGAGPDGFACAVRGEEDATVLVLGIGGLREAIVVRGKVTRADPAGATRLLAHAASCPATTLDRGALKAALTAAVPLVRARLTTLAAARWRATDRDQLSRRLIPMILAEAQRAAREGDRIRLTLLDRLLARLGAGMTAGEETSLSDLVESPSPLTADVLLQWDARLPPLTREGEAPDVRLVAAVRVVRTTEGAVSFPSWPSRPSSSTSTAPSSTRST